MAIAQLAAIAALLIAAPLAAQQKPKPQQHPNWLPNGETRIGNLTPAQRARAVAVLEEIERIFLRVPELARPEGFQIRRSLYGGARPLGPRETFHDEYVVEYMLHLNFYGPGNIAGHASSQCISARVNNVSHWGSRGSVDDQGNLIYLEQKRGNRIPFATVTYGHLLRTQRSGITIAFITADATPWQQATREQYYQSIANEWAGKDREKLADAKKVTQKTPYQTWIEGAAQRRKDHEEGIATLRAIGQDAAEIEKFRKIFEDTEREVGASLKAAEADHRKMQQDLVGNFQATLDSLRADLERMGPAGRRLPAYTLVAEPGGLNATGSAVVSEDGPYVFRGLQLNYDFWRARTSPVEVRSIHVSLSNSLGCRKPAIQKAVRAAYEKLDWAAFDRLLHQPAGEKSWRGGASHELSDDDQ